MQVPQVRINICASEHDLTAVGCALLSTALQCEVRKKIYLQTGFRQKKTVDAKRLSELATVISEVSDLLEAPRLWTQKSIAQLPAIARSRSNRACILHATEVVEKIRTWVSELNQESDPKNPETSKFRSEVLISLQQLLEDLLKSLQAIYRQASTPHLYEKAASALAYLELLFSAEIILGKDSSAIKNRSMVNLSSYKSLCRSVSDRYSPDIGFLEEKPLASYPTDEYSIYMNAGEVLDPFYTQRLLELNRESSWNRLKLRLLKITNK